jgi:sugar/nucleoside kinase (ribokinase family)
LKRSARHSAGRARRRFDVTLVGDANLDIILYGLPEELTPECELLASEMQIHLGGSAAITAHNLAALGNTTGLITTTAGDNFANLCQAELRGAGVDLSVCVPVEGTQTGVTVLLQNRDFRRMLTYAGATFHLDFDRLDIGYLADSRHFHMASYYLQRALTPRIPELFATLKKAGLTISLDSNDDPDHAWDRGILEALGFVDVLMPNEREVCLLAGEPELDRAIATLTQMVPLLIVKRGSGGASAHTATRSWHVPARSVQVVDAVGAGDSFNAGFLHGWLHDWPIEQALAYGNLVGGWSTGSPGGTSAFRGAEKIQALERAWNEMQSVPTDRCSTGVLKQFREWREW